MPERMFDGTHVYRVQVSPDNKLKVYAADATPDGGRDGPWTLVPWEQSKSFDPLYTIGRQITETKARVDLLSMLLCMLVDGDSHDE